MPDAGAPQRPSRIQAAIRSIEAARSAVDDPILAASLEAARAAVEDAVFRNALTDLHNREYVEAVFANSLRTGPITVAFLEVDGFKNVNSLGGHDVGDEVLRAIGLALASITGGGETVSETGTVGAFHLSGDEFVVVLQGLDWQESLAWLAEAKRVAEAIATDRATAMHGSSLPIALTVAAAQADTPADLATALAEADQLCEFAKLLQVWVGRETSVWHLTNVPTERLSRYRSSCRSSERHRFWCPACGFNGYANLPPTDTCPHCEAARHALAALRPSSN